jgi:hypothetical protein
MASIALSRSQTRRSPAGRSPGAPGANPAEQPRLPRRPEAKPVRRAQSMRPGRNGTTGRAITPTISGGECDSAERDLQNDAQVGAEIPPYCEKSTGQQKRRQEQRQRPCVRGAEKDDGNSRKREPTAQARRYMYQEGPYAGLWMFTRPSLPAARAFVRSDGRRRCQPSPRYVRHCSCGSLSLRQFDRCILGKGGRYSALTLLPGFIPGIGRHRVNDPHRVIPGALNLGNALCAPRYHDSRGQRRHGLLLILRHTPHPRLNCTIDMGAARPATTEPAALGLHGRRSASLGRVGA